MKTIKGPIADHFVRMLDLDFIPSDYEGMPHVWHGSADAIKWIEDTIDHSGLVLMVSDAIPTIRYAKHEEEKAYIFGTFASDDDAILFKMRWEGAR